MLSRSFLLLLAALALAACAQKARVTQMSTDVVAAYRIAASPEMQGAFRLGEVTGGEVTYPFWMSKVGTPEFAQALEHSFHVNGLLAPTADAATYRVDADLSKLDQPLMGADFTVTSTVLYRVVEIATETPYFKKSVTVSYTASFSDSVFGATRLQFANEGAIRLNIETFIKKLVTFWESNPPPPKVAPGAVTTSPLLTE